MPDAHTLPGTTVKPAILLLEEYSALAAAISSALKKFAPHHSTHVARSLKEAEALATDARPELFVIDVDPPWPKLTQLLGNLRTEHADARVLIIGATIPKELIENRGLHRALQFLEKPFDVPELGAAVQALLGPWKESESESLRGTLRSFSAVDAALLQCASGRTVVVEVKNNGGKSGELHFVDGQLFHVENGKRAGVEALEELFSWLEPEMREKENRAHPVAKRTIPAPWTEAFLQALQKARIHRPAAVTAPVAKPAVAKAKARMGKKIVLVDDTEMLLIFVEDVLTTADAGLQITTAANGLSGVKEIERVLPDLVLLDYSLPDFNGDEVARRLLENERTAHIPILMMSGHVPEMTRTAAVLENIVATIEKPFLSDALVAVVQQTLKTSPELRRAKSPTAKKGKTAAVTTPAPVSVEAGPIEKPADPVSAFRTEQPRSQRTTDSPPPLPPPLSPQSAPVEAQKPKVEIRQEVVKAPDTPAVPPMPPPSQAPVPPKRPPPPPARTTPASRAAPPDPKIRAPTIPIERPTPHVISVEPPVQQIPRPGIAVSMPATFEWPLQAKSATIAAPVLTAGMNDVVLGLFLEVVSMQLTAALRMGTIRARPSSMTASLHVASPALRAALPANGFQLGAVDLDRSGRIAVIRVIPTVQPFTRLATQSSLQIGSVSVVPANSHERLQLTPRANAPMRMHLLAQLEVAGVELSSTFQISQLVLKVRNGHVRVTLNEQAVGQELTGTACQIGEVQMDAEARLSELTLSPIP